MFGKCPKCIGGQLDVEYDTKNRWDEYCLQCGYRKEIPSTDPRIKGLKPVEAHLQSAPNGLFKGSAPNRHLHAQGMVESDDIRWYQ